MQNEEPEVASNVRFPDEFNFNKPATWSTWLNRFERYVSLKNLSSKPDKEKIDLLCYSMGEKSEDILAQILPQMNNYTTFATVKEKFNSYFSPKKNLVLHRFKFNSRIQQPGESVDSFVRSLYTLAETCDYGTLKEELIRDRIVIGIRESETSERLQSVADLTIDKAIAIARHAELEAEKDKLLMHQRRKTSRASHCETKKSLEEKNPQPENGSCYRCGFPRHARVGECPASKWTCPKCNRVGHCGRVCKSENIRQMEEVGSDVSGEEASRQASRSTVLIHGVTVKALRECPHLKTVEEVPSTGIDTLAPCQECNSTCQNWICLRCYTVHCSRWINRHAKMHGQGNNHPMTLSCGHFNAWCYECEEYIVNPRLDAARNAARRSKFNHDLPRTYLSLRQEH